MMKYLSISEMGIIAMLTLYIGFSTILLDSGFSGAFLRKGNITQKDYDFLFTNSLSISVIIYILSICSASYVKEKYSLDNFFIYLTIIMTSLFFRNKNIVYNLFYLQGGKFKEISRVSNLTQVSGFILLWFFLYLGFKIYAFVFQVLVETIMINLLYRLKFNFKNSLNFNYKEYYEIIKLSYSTLISSLIRVGYDYFLVFFILSNFGIKNLGLYSQANRFNNLFMTAFMGVVDKVTFVNYVKIDNKKLYNKFNLIFSLTLTITFLVLNIAYYFLDFFISNFLELQWSELVNILPFIFIISFLTVADLNVRTLIKAKLSAKTILFNEIYKKIFSIIFLLICILYYQDFYIILRFLVFCAVFNFIISFLSVLKYLKFDIIFILTSTVVILSSLIGLVYIC